MRLIGIMDPCGPGGSNVRGGAEHPLPTALRAQLKLRPYDPNTPVLLE